MSRFLSKLRAEKVPGTRYWIVRQDLVFRDSRDRKWTVPAGFMSDGASIPRPLWSAVGPPWGGAYDEAAVLHDYLYATQPVGRLAADRLFLEAMAALGVRVTQRWALYSGVVLGGWAAWRSHARRNAAVARRAAANHKEVHT